MSNLKSNTKARASDAYEPDADTQSVISTNKKAVDGECLICAESYNLSTRKYIKCMYCDFEACRKCCETYILSENMSHCMNSTCGKPWTKLFISKNFTKVFSTKTLKSHLEQVAFEREQALLPETQIIVEYERGVSKRLNELQNIIIDLAGQLSTYKREQSILSIGLNTALTTGAIPNINTEGNANMKMELESRKNFIRACPADGCRGFLSSRWKCGICEKYTCSECCALKEEGKEHECNPDELATAKLLSKDTKPCPKCASMIFKIDGCDQMWCNHQS